MSPRAQAALIAASVTAWLALGGCGSPDKVIDLLPGSSAGGSGGAQPGGDTGGRSDKPCDSDRQCDSPTPYCDRIAQVCVECASNADCENDNEHRLCLTVGSDGTNSGVAAALEAGTLSSAGLGRCVECITDADCPDQSRCTNEFWCRS